MLSFWEAEIVQAFQRTVRLSACERTWDFAYQNCLL